MAVPAPTYFSLLPYDIIDTIQDYMDREPRDYHGYHFNALHAVDLRALLLTYELDRIGYDIDVIRARMKRARRCSCIVI